VTRSQKEAEGRNVKQENGVLEEEAGVVASVTAAGTAGLASVLANASAPGNLAGVSVSASAGPVGVGSLPSWNVAAVGYGALETVLPQAAAGKAAGQTSEDLTFADIASPLSTDLQEAPNDSLPAPEAPMTPEGSQAPVLLPEDGFLAIDYFPALALPVDYTNVDGILTEFAPIRPVTDGVSSPGPRSAGREEGAGEVYWLLPLLSGLAVHQGAAQGNARRLLAELNRRRALGS
jgi:hypothetical protein